VVIDDLVTTGKNILQAAEAIRAEGGRVEHVVVLIDRQEGGKEALASAGLKLHAFVTITEIARRLMQAGIIEDDQYQAIVAQTGTQPGA
jgi:orotate phosphoribosyltransferase